MSDATTTTNPAINTGVGQSIPNVTVPTTSETVSEIEERFKNGNIGENDIEPSDVENQFASQAINEFEESQASIKTGVLNFFKSLPQKGVRGVLGTTRIINKLEETGLGKYQTNNVELEGTRKETKGFVQMLNNLRSFAGFYTGKEFKLNEVNSLNELLDFLKEDSLKADAKRIFGERAQHRGAEDFNSLNAETIKSIANETAILLLAQETVNRNIKQSAELIQTLKGIEGIDISDYIDISQAENPAKAAIENVAHFLARAWNGGMLADGVSAGVRIARFFTPGGALQIGAATVVPAVVGVWRSVDRVLKSHIESKVSTISWSIGSACIGLFIGFSSSQIFRDINLQFGKLGAGIAKGLGAAEGIQKWASQIAPMLPNYVARAISSRAITTGIILVARRILNKGEGFMASLGRSFKYADIAASTSIFGGFFERYFTPDLLNYLFPNQQVYDEKVELEVLSNPVNQLQVTVTPSNVSAESFFEPGPNGPWNFVMNYGGQTRPILEILSGREFLIPAGGLKVNLGGVNVLLPAGMTAADALAAYAQSEKKVLFNSEAGLESAAVEIINKINQKTPGFIPLESEFKTKESARFIRDDLGEDPKRLGESGELEEIPEEEIFKDREFSRLQDGKTIIVTQELPDFGDRVIVREDTSIENTVFSAPTMRILKETGTGILSTGVTLADTIKDVSYLELYRELNKDGNLANVNNLNYIGSNPHGANPNSTAYGSSGNPGDDWGVEDKPTLNYAMGDMEIIYVGKGYRGGEGEGTGPFTVFGKLKESITLNGQEFDVYVSYGHQGSATVSGGSTVDAGDVVGVSSNLGAMNKNIRNDHLDFQVRLAPKGAIVFDSSKGYGTFNNDMSVNIAAAPLVNGIIRRELSYEFIRKNDGNYFDKGDINITEETLKHFTGEGDYAQYSIRNDPKAPPIITMMDTDLENRMQSLLKVVIKDNKFGTSPTEKFNKALEIMLLAYPSLTNASDAQSPSESALREAVNNFTTLGNVSTDKLIALYDIAREEVTNPPKFDDSVRKYIAWLPGLKIDEWLDTPNAPVEIRNYYNEYPEHEHLVKTIVEKIYGTEPPVSWEQTFERIEILKLGEELAMLAMPEGRNLNNGFGITLNQRGVFDITVDDAGTVNDHIRATPDLVHYYRINELNRIIQEGKYTRDSLEDLIETWKAEDTSVDSLNLAGLDSRLAAKPANYSFTEYYNYLKAIQSFNRSPEIEDPDFVLTESDAAYLELFDKHENFFEVLQFVENNYKGEIPFGITDQIDTYKLDQPITPIVANQIKTRESEILKLAVFFYESGFGKGEYTGASVKGSGTPATSHPTQFVFEQIFWALKNDTMNVLPEDLQTQVNQFIDSEGKVNLEGLRDFMLSNYKYFEWNPETEEGRFLDLNDQKIDDNLANWRIGETFEEYVKRVEEEAIENNVTVPEVFKNIRAGNLIQIVNVFIIEQNLIVNENLPQNRTETFQKALVLVNELYPNGYDPKKVDYDYNPERRNYAKLGIDALTGRSSGETPLTDIYNEIVKKYDGNIPDVPETTNPIIATVPVRSNIKVSDWIKFLNDPNSISIQDFPKTLGEAFPEFADPTKQSLLQEALAPFRDAEGVLVNERALAFNKLIAELGIGMDTVDGKIQMSNTLKRFSNEIELLFPSAKGDIRTETQSITRMFLQNEYYDQQPLEQILIQIENDPNFGAGDNVVQDKFVVKNWPVNQSFAQWKQTGNNQNTLIETMPGIIPITNTSASVIDAYLKTINIDDYLNGNVAIPSGISVDEAYLIARNDAIDKALAYSAIVWGQGGSVFGDNDSLVPVGQSRRVFEQSFYNITGGGGITTDHLNKFDEILFTMIPNKDELPEGHPLKNMQYINMIVEFNNYASDNFEEFLAAYGPTATGDKNAFREGFINKFNN